MAVETHLPVFLAVCEARGFGRAARRLGISQPSVSYRIRQLELALGSKVIERGTGRFQLTPVGARLAQLGSAFAVAVRELSEEIQRRDPSLEGPLRISTVTGFGRYVLLPLLLETPGRLTCWFRTAEETAALVRNGEVDLGFVYVRLPSHALRFEPVYQEELVLITPVSGREWRKVDWMGRGAESAPFVTYEEHDYVFGQWFAAIRKRQSTQLTSVAHFDELEETIDAVAAGWGASIVPEDAARKYGGRRVRIVHPAGRRAFNQVWLVRRPAPLAPQAERALANLRLR